MKKTLLACIFGLLVSTSAFAVTGEVYLDPQVPKPWRLQTYTSATSEVIVVFFTPSPCVSGKLDFPSTVPSEKNRFWNTVLAAKLANKKMFVSYFRTDDTAGAAVSCVITSYAVMEE